MAFSFRHRKTGNDRSSRVRFSPSGNQPEQGGIDGLSTVERLIAAVVLVLFVAGAGWWFVDTTSTSQHDFDVGQVFVGLGYMSGVLLVSLLAMWGWRLLRLADPGASITPSRRARGPRDNQSIIHSQLAWGSMLVIIGAVIGALCLSFVGSDVSGPVLALATAVISAGAVLLPAGAATGAAGRMQQQLQDLGLPVVTMVHATRKDGTSASLVGNVVPNRNEVDAYFEFQEAPPKDPSVTPAAIAQVQPIYHILADVTGQTVEAELTTLEEGKAYQVRLAAKRPAGPAVQSAWVKLDPPGQPASVPAPTQPNPPPTDQPNPPPAAPAA